MLDFQEKVRFIKHLSLSNIEQLGQYYSLLTGSWISGGDKPIKDPTLPHSDIIALGERDQPGARQVACGNSTVELLMEELREDQDQESWSQTGCSAAVMLLHTSQSYETLRPAIAPNAMHKRLNKSLNRPWPDSH